MGSHAIRLGLVRDGSPLAATLPADLAFLGIEEQARAAQFTAVRRRQQFLLGRWLVRCMLAQRFGQRPQDWQLSAPASGAPAILSPLPSPLHFSLSHSGDWAGCALAAVPVGLDLETPQRPRRIAELARRVCTPAEQAELATLPAPAQARAFSRMWTLKEAWLKQQGLGIDSMRMRRLQAQPATGSAVNALTFENREGLQGALSTDTTVGPLEWFGDAAGLGVSGEWKLQEEI